MAAPEGYISLGFVGFTDKGEFSSDIVYAKNDVVHKDNAIWKCLVDDTVGIAPVEGGGNWEIFIQSQTKANGIKVTDTFGVVGDTGEVVVAQTFLDSLADKVMNQVLKKADLVNNALATIPGQAALDSAMGKNFQNQIDGINSNLGIQIIENQDILSYCLSLDFVEQRNFYVGGTATGIPDDSCKYSYGNCRKLDNTFSQISIYPKSSGGIIYTNTYSGTKWDGWRKGVSDLELSNAKIITGIPDIAPNKIPFIGEPSITIGTYTINASNRPNYSGGCIIGWKYSDENIQLRAFSNDGYIFKRAYNDAEWSAM